MKNNISDVGVIVGRFQVAQLHNGHKELIDFVKSNHKKVIIVLGIPVVAGLIENPLDYQSRQLMINIEYPDILVVPLKDCRSNLEWSNKLDELILSCINPSQSITLYGARDSFIKSYNGKLFTQELFGENDSWSGTKSRNIVRQTVKASEDFRTGVIWQSFNSYPKVITTVDIAIVDSNCHRLLLGRKVNEKLWRFIGGFTDPTNNSNEEDAIRELKEETGLYINKSLKYIGSCNINDWRYTGRDKIRTSFFMAECIEGMEKASDDISELKWLNISEVTPSTTFVSEHLPLWDMFYNFIDR